MLSFKEDLTHYKPRIAKIIYKQKTLTKSKHKSVEAHNNVSLYFYFSWINAFKKIIIFSLKKI